MLFSFHFKHYIHKIYNILDYLIKVCTEEEKMLSLLDFSGHSAYHAFHHIFFSPRTIYILVVDMTKELDSVAAEASKESDLIYSNWTYAGNLLKQLNKM